MIRTFVPVFLVLLSAGCDPVYNARIDVREGLSPSTRVVGVKALQEMEELPVEGAKVEFWQYDSQGNRICDRAGLTGRDGKITFGPFFDGANDFWYVRCSKEGYTPVDGTWRLGEIGLRGSRTLLVMMKKTGQEPATQ